VRTGNAAAGQFQLDVYGEIADARYWLMLEKGFADGQHHYDPHRGRLVGNFPQALSHLALVNTALLLFRRRGAGTARERGDHGAVSSSPASGGQPDGAESQPHPGAPRHLCIPGAITSRQHRPAEHPDHEQAEAAHDHERRH